MREQPRAMVGVCAMVAAMIPASLPSAPAVAGDRPVPENINVSRTPDSQSEPSIAVDPTSPDRIVVASNREIALGLFEGISENGGRTWRRRIIGADDRLGSICCDPSLSWDGWGNLFLTYLDFANGFGKVPLALSTDGGETFRRIAEIGNPNHRRSAVGLRHPDPLPGRASFVQVDQPTVVTGHDSVWVYFNGDGPMFAAGAWVHGLGQVGSFRRAEQLPRSRGGTFGDIAIGPRGEALGVWERPSDTEGPARIWSNLDPDGLGPAPFRAPRVVTTTNVGGLDALPAQPNRTVDAEAGLAWEKSGPFAGRIAMVYTDEHPNEGNDFDVFVRHSDDGGTTWSDRARVNDDRTANSQFLPRIALDPYTGLLAASWYDARGDDGSRGPGDTDGRPNDDAQLWTAFSYDGGRSFGGNIRVSGGTSNARRAFAPIDYGDYTGLAFVAGVAHPAWADNSNSTHDNPDGRLHGLDIYTAAIGAFR